MPWWGWLIVGVLATLLVVLVVILLLRKKVEPGLSEEERKAIADAERNKVAEELRIAREKSASLAKVATQLRENLSQLQEDFEKRKGLINDEKRKEMERLVADNDALGTELDSILGIQRDDDTKPG